MLTLAEFFTKLDNWEIMHETLIVCLRYKYSFEKDFIEENEILLHELNRNGDSEFVWESDWDEGQTSCGEVYVVGWASVDDVNVQQGQWMINEQKSGYLWKCSNCKGNFDQRFSYCPYCGSKMVGGFENAKK